MKDRKALHPYYTGGLSHPIIPVPTDDPRVTPKFAAVGKMVQVGGVIWSGVPTTLTASMASMALSNVCFYTVTPAFVVFKQLRGEFDLLYLGSADSEVQAKNNSTTCIKSNINSGIMPEIIKATVVATCLLFSFEAAYAGAKGKAKESNARKTLAPTVGLCGAALGGAIGGPVGGALGYCGAIACADVLEYCGWDVFDQRWRTAEWYNRADKYFPAKEESEDYSEGLYLKDGGGNDFHEDSKKATRAKFEFIFTELGLQSIVDANSANGKVTKVLDAGCGNGAWMEFLREKGIEPVGLTLSDSQKQNILKKGFKEDQILVWDYTQELSAFKQEFDAVTALGSTEHLCSPVGRLRSSQKAEENCRKTLANTWKLFYGYLKPQGSVFITSLTNNDERSRENSDYTHHVDGYLLERSFGGYYPKIGTIERAVNDAGFDLVETWDFTAHYHWASVLNLRPGGSWYVEWRKNTLEKLLRFPRDFIVDPHLIHFWAGYYRDSWLRHLGGKQNTPLTEEQAKNSPAHLKYVLFTKKDSQPN